MSGAAQPAPGRFGARLSALGDRAPATRGARFLARAEGRALAGVSALAAVPDWHGWRPERRARLGATAVLLRHRPALDRELSAARLAPLAALVGEDLFDAICDAPRATALEDTEAALPSLAALNALGEQLLARALPAVLGGSGDAGAVELVDRAAALVTGREARA